MQARSIILIVVAIVAIVAIVVVAGVAALFFFGGKTPVLLKPQNQTGNKTSTGIVLPPRPPGVNDTEYLWSIITLENVEKACLAAAKKAAGANAWAVSDCKCTVALSQYEKAYACKISALDGTHNASVECNRDPGFCIITSEQGTLNYTLQQLYNLASG